MRLVSYTWIETPLGDVAVAWCGYLERIGIGPNAARVLDPSWRHDPGLDCEATRQLRAYFRGELTEFRLDTVMRGTTFQRAVWRELQEIPYGTTATYGEIAKRVGEPAAARAVGMACNRNPLPIVVPCHRVVGADGRLVGFGGGLPMKEGLLELESRRSGRAQPTLFAL